MNNTKQPLGVNLQGKYKVAVVDAVTNVEQWRQPEWGNNLILNKGLDQVVSTYMARLMQYGICGTGTRVNSQASGDSNGSVAGGYLMLDVGATGIQDFNSTTYGGWVGGILTTGDVVKFSDSTEVAVVTVGATSASVSTAGTVSTQSFTIWKTSQTALQTEIKRGGLLIADSTYLIGVGNCGTTVTAASGLVQHRLTYDFPSESFQRNYTEVGVSWNPTIGTPNTTFSRIVLNTPVTVSLDQRLRLVYELNVQYSPTASIYVSNAPISGWPVSPSTNTHITQSLQSNFSYAVARLDTSGGLTDAYISGLEIPIVYSNNSQIWGSTNSQSLTPLGTSAVDRVENTVAVNASLGTYVAGSFTVTKSGTFDLNSLNLTTLRSFGFGAGGLASPNGIFNVFAMVFDQPQTKTNVQTLSMTFKYSWGRTLA